MLIVLGGLLGSGAKTLAGQLAMKSGLHHYDIDQKKLREPVLDPHGDFRILQPRTDKDRVKVYESVFKEFPLLSKMYTDVVVDDVFHRDVPREYFLSEARKYFDPVVFVWVESDEDSVKIRLERMEKAGKVPSLAAAMRRRKTAQMKMQPLPPSAPVFSHRASGEEGIAARQAMDRKVAALWKLIQQNIRS